jgi:rhodanese-related sulfurtransferase
VTGAKLARVTAFGEGDGLHPRAAHELLASGRAIALDVRELYEWEAGRIPGSLHIPLSRLPGHLGDLPDADVIAVCRSGSRSDAVTDALRGRGMRVENLLGGLQAWERDGLPIEPDGGWIA